MPQTTPSDPFAQLLAEAQAHAQARRRKGKSTGPKRTSAPPKRPPASAQGFLREDTGKPFLGTSPWQDEAVVLLIHQRTCAQCGSSYEAPEGLFLMRSRLLPGARLDHSYERLTLEQARSAHTHLPRRRLVRALSVPACELCFDTEETLAHIARAQAPFGWQPELPLGAGAGAPSGANPPSPTKES